MEFDLIRLMDVWLDIEKAMERQTSARVGGGPVMEPGETFHAFFTSVVISIVFLVNCCFTPLKSSLAQAL